jgi:hypothetical protein
MALFGPKQIPATSYGYQPPTGATAWGWACVNSYSCGAMVREPVKRWPKACPKCGSPTDPLFDDPWDHEARGVELEYRIRNNVESGGFDEDQWQAWRFKDAAMRGDRAGMAEARISARRRAQDRLAAGNSWTPASIFIPLTHEGHVAGDLDGVADDLLYWMSVSSLEDVETHNNNRANARQLIDAVERFLQAGGEGRPKAAEVKQGALKIAEAAYPILNAQQQATVMRMSRSS